MDYPNPQEYYTKAEVDVMIAAAVAQAHEADRILMAKHNRTATIISMILGAICLALLNCLDPIFILTEAVKAAPRPKIIGVNINSSLEPKP